MWSLHSPLYSLHMLTPVPAIALGDGSKALMLVFISPSEDNVGERICSMNFAKRTRAVESNRGLLKAICYVSLIHIFVVFALKFQYLTRPRNMQWTKVVHSLWFQSLIYALPNYFSKTS